MKDVPRPDVSPVRREPKTKRGRRTQEEILRAARDVMWLSICHDVPFTELAVKAGVARASLLHAFPHWRDVRLALLVEEVHLLSESYLAALALKRVRPTDRAYAMLAPLLDRAEKTGRLYPNLRGEVFVRHDEALDQDLVKEARELRGPPEGGRAFLPHVFHRHYVGVEDLLGIPREKSLKSLQGLESRPAPIGECLVNFAFDLAAGSPTLFATFDERRRTLRSVIDVVAAGIRTSKPLRAKKRRGKLRDS